MFKPYLSTRLYDISGELISELYDEKRQYTSFDQISPNIIRAFIAAEDTDFYTHRGFDAFAMFRAFVIDVASGSVKQGGSTITQQLAKQLYTGSNRTLYRKVSEFFIAKELERRYNKNQIMEMYCNQVYFGHGLYGVQAASRFFFAKESAELSPCEAAVLAGIPSAPSKNSPLKNPKAAMERSRRVISAMVRQGMLSGNDAIASYAQFWDNYADKLHERFPTATAHDDADKAPYFTEYVRQLLIKQYGESAVYRGGLTVYTTLDLKQQQTAQKLLAKAAERQNRIASYHNAMAMSKLNREAASAYKMFSHDEYGLFKDTIADEASLLAELLNANDAAMPLAELAGRYEIFSSEAQVETALAAVDTATGGIRAIVGGSGWTQQNQLNRAWQSYRQPGSAFKVFVYGAGIEAKKITAASQYLDMPVTFYNGKGAKEKIWEPTNYGATFLGPVLARRALALSVNTVPVLIYDDIGGRRVRAFAAKMLNIPEKRFAKDPTIALGSSEISPLEMAAGFVPFATGGIRREPFAVLTIYDSTQKVLYRRKADEGQTQVMSAEAAYVMNSMLGDVITRGTASSAKAYGFNKPAIGKTGTSSKFRDAWFVGAIPELSVAVWVGCNSQKFGLGEGQTGAVAALPVWIEFMKEVCKHSKVGGFPKQPETLQRAKICRKTGMLASMRCPQLNEIFIAGTVPTETCNGEHYEMQSVFDVSGKKSKAASPTQPKGDDIQSATALPTDEGVRQ